MMITSAVETVSLNSPGYNKMILNAVTWLILVYLWGKWMFHSIVLAFLQNLFLPL